MSTASDLSDPIALGAILSNTSNQPSMYTVVSVFIDRRVKIVKPDGYENVGETEFAPNDKRHNLRRRSGFLAPILFSRKWR
jgi:hypothetical protein